MESLIHDILMIFFIAICSGCFSYLLDYALGQPGKEDASEVNERAILFFWSYYLAANRMKVTNKYFTRQTKKDLFATGRDLFTWEFAFGMCMYCTNYWVSVLLFALPAIIFDLANLQSLPNFILLLTTPIFSHFILRKI